MSQSEMKCLKTTVAWDSSLVPRNINIGVIWELKMIKSDTAEMRIPILPTFAIPKVQRAVSLPGPRAKIGAPGLLPCGHVRAASDI